MDYRQRLQQLHKGIKNPPKRQPQLQLSPQLQLQQQSQATLFVPVKQLNTPLPMMIDVEAQVRANTVEIEQLKQDLKETNVKIEVIEDRLSDIDSIVSNHNHDIKTLESHFVSSVRDMRQSANYNYYVKTIGTVTVIILLLILFI